jgi:uncharacterized protein YndB with AHSA1/START domain
MAERIERELVVEATPEEVWEVVLGDGWLADEVKLDLRPGGEATFRSTAEQRAGWIEEVSHAHKLAFWWARGDEPATRVELTLLPEDGATRVRVTETRPLEILDLVGLPLPGTGRSSYGPALVAA